ncbi:MAG: hypothetical protein ACP5T3_00695 [Candidatus Micrarchaeia archaeon]
MAKSPKVKLVFIKAMSLKDICRLACNLQNPGILFASNSNGVVRFAVLGERLDGVQLAYYANVEKPGKFVNYVAPSHDEQERATISDTAEFLPQPGDKCSINVLTADFSGMEQKTAPKNLKIESVKFASLLDLAKAAIRHSASNDQAPYLYSFETNSGTVLGAFDLLDELSDDRHVFYYAIAERASALPLIAYNYKNDSVDFVASADEHSYFYIKQVALAEPIPFIALMHNGK